jgi:hypothetical protein
LGIRKSTCNFDRKAVGIKFLFIYLKEFTGNGRLSAFGTEWFSKRCGRVILLHFSTFPGLVKGRNNLFAVYFFLVEKTNRI